MGIEQKNIYIYDTQRGLVARVIDKNSNTEVICEESLYPDVFNNIIRNLNRGQIEGVAANEDTLTFYEKKVTLYDRYAEPVGDFSIGNKTQEFNMPYVETGRTNVEIRDYQNMVEKYADNEELYELFQKINDSDAKNSKPSVEKTTVKRVNKYSFRNFVAGTLATATLLGSLVGATALINKITGSSGDEPYLGSDKDILMGVSDEELARRDQIINGGQTYDVKYEPEYEDELDELINEAGSIYAAEEITNGKIK